MREVAAQFDRPVLLFSGGKDSIVMVHLARKAFHPATHPFPVVHIDTGHNFPETLEFRDSRARDTGGELLVRQVQDSIDQGRAQEAAGRVVLCAFVSPCRTERERVRSLLPEGRFLEVHVDADLDTLRDRDTKGLYARAARGELEGLTRVAAVYEAPDSPELRVDTSALTLGEAVDRGLALLGDPGHGI
jgi:hypothetical protein